MSVLLLDALEPFVRSRFDKKTVATVQPYGGEFNAEEIAQVSFACPAILLSVLGWEQAPPETKMAGVRGSRLVGCAAFVVTKGSKREDRMREAALLADQLAIHLGAWRPADTDALYITPVEEEPTCENAYGRAVDKHGLALWVVSWGQCVRPRVAPGELVDLLRVDIETNVVQPSPEPGAEAPELTVTDKITFGSET